MDSMNLSTFGRTETDWPRSVSGDSQRWHRPAGSTTVRSPVGARTSRDASFARLCSECRDSVLRYVRWLTGDSHTAEDIVQIVLVRAWKGFHLLEDDRAVHGWLKTIARREVARAYSRKRLDTEDLETLSPSDQLSPVS